MKVPTLDVIGQVPAPRVRSAQPMQISPDQSVARGVAQAGQALQQGGQALAQVIGQVQAEADEVMTAERMADLERLQTRAFYGDPAAKVEGFLAKKGKAASDAHAALLDDLEKGRQKLADSLATPRQRAAFARRSHAMLADSERRAFAHVATEQQRLNTEIIESRKKEVLGAVQNAPPGRIEDEAMQKRVDDVAETIGTLLKGREEPELKQWKAEVAAARIAGDLQRHDVASAKARLASTRKDLEPLGPDALTRINHQVELASIRVLAEDTVGTILKESSAGNVDGFVSETKAAELLEKRMVEVPLEYRARVRSLFNAQTALAAKAEREKKDEARKESFRTVEAGGMHALHSKADLEAFLERNDPQYLARLKHSDDVKHRRAAAAAKGGAEGAAARREQARANRIARKILMAMPTDERAAADPDTLLNDEEWAAMGVDHVDAEGKLEMQAIIRRAKETVNKGHGSAENEFIRFAEQMAGPDFKGKRPKYKPEDKPALRAAAALAFETHLKKTGEPPTREEQEKMLPAIVSSFKEEAEEMAKAREKRRASPTPAATPRAEPPHPPKRNAQIEAAEKWLAENPNDPRAPKMRAKLEQLKAR